MDLLRTSLKLDAAVTGLNGAAYLALAGPLGDLLGFAPSLLRGAGALLLAFTALVAWTGIRRPIWRPAVVAVAGANLAWAAGSVVAVLADLGTPATAGAAWVVAQALVVAGFAELQLTGLRRAAGSAAGRGVASPA